MQWIEIDQGKTAINRFVFSILVFFLILSTLWLVVLWDVYHPQPALALIQQQEEGQDQMLYQARHTLRDLTGGSWQVVLFERVQGNRVKDLSLRLVGFPEKNSFRHPQSLNFSTQQGLILQAQDLFAEQAPAPNVGQYEMSDILTQLPVSASITLTLPLETEQQIIVPIPVLLEWHTFLKNHPVK